ncbi:hypothetical protein [Sphingomonas metalli]|uniref:hypothetical protein n=1 Tax=Sphingomonas metalli TaxID=1779358 RepID=UPI001E287C9F|nr:hypothetical protein [Sphingomonas metalli]
MDDRPATHAALIARIAALDVRAPYCDASVLTREVEALRHASHLAGFDAAVTVAHFIGTALLRGGNPGVHGWLSLLAQAIDCETQDLAACDLWATACAERLAA